MNHTLSSSSIHSLTGPAASPIRNREEAEQVFRAAIARNPNDSFAYHKLGLLLEEGYRRTDAVKCYEMAIATNSRNFPAYNSLANAVKSENRQRALSLFIKCLELKPNYGRAWKNLGLLYFHDLKDKVKARDALQRAVQVDPNNASCYVALGQLLEQDFKDIQGAEKAYTAATVADDRNPMGFAKLACMRTTSDPQKAKVLFEMALRCCPTDPFTLSRYGKFALNQLEDIPRARVLLKAAVEHCPEDPRIRQAYATLRKRQSMKEKQQQQQRRASAAAEAEGGMGSGSDLSHENLMAESPTGSETGMSQDDIGGTVTPTDDAAEQELRRQLFSFTPMESNFSGFLTTSLPTDLKCPQGHTLEVVTQKPPLYTAKSTWACEECQKSIGGIELKINGAFFCAICKYDLCYSCSKRPQTAHVMPEDPVELGVGTFGTVYKEYDFVLNSYVAVKVLRHATLDEVNREAQIQQRFRGHPNIINVFRVEQKGNAIRVLMELAKGSVKDLLKQEGALTEGVARRYIREALRGLAALQQAGVIHRDIKPDNLLLSVDTPPSVKLSDFGLSKDVPVQTMVQTLMLKGTPHYLPPECCDSPPRWTCSADIWALALTWINMVTGHSPWYGTGLEHSRLETLCYRLVNEELTPIIPNFLSAEARGILRLCLERKKDNRPRAAKLLELSYFASADDALPMDVEAANEFSERLKKLMQERSGRDEESTYEVEDVYADVGSSGSMTFRQTDSQSVGPTDSVAPHSGAPQSVGSSPSASLSSKAPHTGGSVGKGVHLPLSSGAKQFPLGGGHSTIVRIPNAPTLPATNGVVGEVGSRSSSTAKNTGLEPSVATGRAQTPQRYFFLAIVAMLFVLLVYVST